MEQVETKRRDIWHQDNGPVMIGIGYALLSAALFGASAPLAKMLLGEVSPWLLAGLLYLGSGLGLAMLRLVWRSKETGLARADLPWLAGAVVSGGMLGPVLLMFGLALSPASAGALLLNLESVFTLALAWIVFRENVDLRIGLGAAAIVAGAVALSLPVGMTLPGGMMQGGTMRGETMWGALLIAGACLCWAIDNNLTRKVSAADPMQVAMVKGLSAGAVNVAIAMAAGAALPGLPAIGVAGLVGFLGYGVSLSLFILALRHLGTARTGAYFALAPFIGAVLAVAMLHEAITLPLAIGGALMAIGLWLHLTEKHEHLHEHEPMEHDHLHVHDEHHQHDHPAGMVVTEPHAHPHRHERLIHRHVHYPDLHHRHSH
jgi:drug/metabolite transporter (DMT)-like permease